MLIPKLKEIEVILWDLDGTLYRSFPELVRAIENSCITIIADKRKLNFDDAYKLLDKTREIYQSNTRSMQILGCGKRTEIIRKVEEKVDKASFLKIDPRLQQLFQELSIFHLRHFILSDTTHDTIIKELSALGLSHNLFEGILGIDDVKTSKPDVVFFKKALDLTNLKPQKHLMVGDRVKVDLTPAKQLGMKTCLVWKESEEFFPQNDQGIDFCLKTVYDLITLFKDQA